MPTGNGFLEKIQAGARFAVFISHSNYDKQHGFIPCVAVENEAGYTTMGGQGEHATPWYWGHDYKKACEIADEYNQRLGVSKIEATEILASSMAVSKIR